MNFLAAAIMGLPVSYLPAQLFLKTFPSFNQHFFQGVASFSAGIFFRSQSIFCSAVRLEYRCSGFV